MLCVKAAYIVKRIYVDNVMYSDASKPSKFDNNFVIQFTRTTILKMKK